MADVKISVWDCCLAKQLSTAGPALSRPNAPLERMFMAEMFLANIWNSENQVKFQAVGYKHQIFSKQNLNSTLDSVKRDLSLG